jgi:hypothetical protein
MLMKPSTGASACVSLIALIISLTSIQFVSSEALAAQESPQTFTYQGRLMNAAGTAPLSGMVWIKFGIYNPAETCLLYEEISTGIDVTATQGVFSWRVGSNLPDLGGKRTGSDPGNNMSKVFANDTTCIMRTSLAAGV